MDIDFQNGKNPPELAVCWYLGQMLATKNYFYIFLETFLKENALKQTHIKNLKIIREKSYGNKRIDLCLYITDDDNNKYGMVIEAKTHWPDDEQLRISVEKFRAEHRDYKEVFGLHFLSTIDPKQHNALQEHNWRFEIVKMKELLKSYCESGIEHGHSLRWASDLHQLLTYNKSLPNDKFSAHVLND